MKATINIPDRLYKAAKKKAVEKGTTVTALVVEGLQHVVDGRTAKEGAYKLPDMRFKGGQGLQPGIDLSDWDQIRSLIYEGRGG